MSPSYLPVNQNRLDLLANYLARPAEIEMFYTQFDFSWNGSSGSIAGEEKDYRGPNPSDFSWTARLPTFTHSLVRLWVTVMAEQALAIARLITDPDIGVHGIIAVEVCARSAVESGGKAWWLADPDISPHERMVRFQLEQLHSAYAAETLASEMGWAAPVDELGFSATSGQVKQSCADLGLAVSGPRKYPMIEGVQRPSTTDLVSQLLGRTVYQDSKAMVYRLLSATTHGTFYGIMRAFRPTDETLKGERVVERFADHRIIESAACVTLEAFAVLIVRIVEFMGWDRYKAQSFRNMVGNLVTSGPR